MAFVFSINEVMGGGVGYKRDIVSFLLVCLICLRVPVGGS